MEIKRELESQVLQDLSQPESKICVLYGPRQVGKTTLAKTILKTISKKSMLFTTDDREILHALSSQNLTQLKLLTAGYDVICIDEAQRVENIGLTLKLLHDNFKPLKIIATGSSSFDLANKIKEPLTGRTRTHTLYPISIKEFGKDLPPFELKRQLETLLLYGSYPDILTSENQLNKIRDLNELTSAYLYKDILEIATLKYPKKIRDLLQLLAYQIGSEVSLSELGRQLEMSKETVSHYIDLLEKAFVIFRVSGFSKNLRKEVSKMDKLYFVDLGVRNSIIQNFQPLTQRNDQGALWENFLIIERLKHLHYTQRHAHPFFWRTHTGAELDYIEDYNTELSGFEFKYTKTQSTPPKSWLTTYPNASYTCISKDNFREFLGLDAPPAL
jgi:predicted AAA+ superfamily ATPase